ncbi:MAG: flagella basal body P-ring formation protein FlgA [Spirochaetes bacterium]|nr:flagella basal body P-ring formation protein FlgA [Spirochaetota bacterium]
MLRCGAVIVLIALSAPCFAGGDIFLYPRVNRTSENIVFSDIAKIEADPGTTIRISGIVVDEGRVSDGYLDKNEVLDILRESGVGDVAIYGSGVRVFRETAGADAAMAAAPVVVKKGKAVRFQVVGRCMRVEVPGTAMHDGAVGDVIPVKLKGTVVSRGTIINDRVVELSL